MKARERAARRAFGPIANAVKCAQVGLCWPPSLPGNFGGTTGPLASVEAQTLHRMALTRGWNPSFLGGRACVPLGRRLRGIHCVDMC